MLRSVVGPAGDSWNAGARLSRYTRLAGELKQWGAALLCLAHYLSFLLHLRFDLLCPKVLAVNLCSAFLSLCTGTFELFHIWFSLSQMIFGVGLGEKLVIELFCCGCFICFMFGLFWTGTLCNPGWPAVPIFLY